MQQWSQRNVVDTQGVPRAHTMVVTGRQAQFDMDNIYNKYFWTAFLPNSRVPEEDVWHLPLSLLVLEGLSILQRQQGK